MPGISVGYLNGVSGKTDDIREGIRKVFNYNKFIKRIQR